MPQSNVYPLHTVDESDDTSIVVLSHAQKKLLFVEKELLLTLSYVSSQLDEIDGKGENQPKFNKGLYEVKKMFVEQKLNLLKQIAALADNSIKKDTDIKTNDIASLLGA